jgi:hypothetical protein
MLQVILMRTTDSYETLPQLLKESNALTMTAPQSKASAFQVVNSLHTVHNHIAPVMPTSMQHHCISCYRGWSLMTSSW